MSMNSKSVWRRLSVALVSFAILAPTEVEAAAPLAIAPATLDTVELDTVGRAATTRDRTVESIPSKSIANAIEQAASASIAVVPVVSAELDSARLHGESIAADAIAAVAPTADPLEAMSEQEWQRLVNEEDAAGDPNEAAPIAVSVEPTAAPELEAPSEAQAIAPFEEPPFEDLPFEDLPSEEPSELTAQAIAPSDISPSPSSESMPVPVVPPVVPPVDSPADATTVDATTIDATTVTGEAGVAAMAQVTSVSQLADVQPSDWAFQALQSLVERYGVIAGYPDGTFRGARSLSRYEFAAALNAALDAISAQIAQNGERPRREDLQTIERLNADFQLELDVLDQQVDTLEARTAELEAQQFSTTAILNGQTIIGLAGAGGGDPPGTGEGNVVLSYLTLLQISTSFTGNDVLRVGLEAGNFSDRGFANPSSLNTNMALLNYQTDTDDRLLLESLEYRLALGDRLVVTIKPIGFSLNTVLSTNSLFTSAGAGALSRFAAYSPVFRLGNLDSGLGFDWLLSDRARLQVAYGARDASDPASGLFDSDHHALGVQLFVRPTANITTGIAYVNAFSGDGRLDTFTGSNDADVSGGFGEPSTIHALTGTLQWEITPHLVFGAWGGAFGTLSRRSDAAALSTTYQFSLAFPDPFGRAGDLLGIMVGQPPRLRAEFASGAERDDAIALHYEAFYRFRVNDNLSITPGFFWVTNPGHIADNNDIFVGVVRSTFSF